jgi:hypothetical protein
VLSRVRAVAAIASFEILRRRSGRRIGFPYMTKCPGTPRVKTYLANPEPLKGARGKITLTSTSTTRPLDRLS